MPSGYILYVVENGMCSFYGFLPIGHFIQVLNTQEKAKQYGDTRVAYYLHINE